jgi:hypothetical protein
MAGRADTAHSASAVQLATYSRKTVNRADELWKEALAAFAGHRLGVDRNAQAALNRIAAKCVGFSFDSTTCSIHEEVLDAEALHRLRVFHDIATPAREVEPIVVLSFKGARYVIDGNKRVNLWKAAREPQPRRALIIEPTEAGYAHWLLP